VHTVRTIQDLTPKVLHEVRTLEASYMIIRSCIVHLVRTMQDLTPKIRLTPKVLVGCLTIHISRGSLITAAVQGELC